MPPPPCSQIGAELGQGHSPSPWAAQSGPGHTPSLHGAAGVLGRAIFPTWPDWDPATCPAPICAAG